MDCKITSTKSRRAGVTLVELLVGIGLGSIVLMSVASFSLYSGRSVASLTNYADLESRSRLALDRMSQEIRQTKGLTDFTSTALTFKDADGTALSYVYDPSAKTLARLKNGNRQVLLEQCDYLKFEMFQRTPINGSYNVYPATTAATAKLIQVTWGCSRSILGTAMNTEIVQSAKIVIRKRDQV
jgi:Tfp pilus assembly protein PilW